MKTKFYLSAIILLAIISFTSCKKEAHDRSIFGNNPVNITLNTTIKTGESYTLNLTAYGNGTATITKQPVSYAISQISQDAAGNSIYNYRTSLGSKAGDAVTDQTILKINTAYENSGGCNNHHNDGSTERYITINFKVQ